MSTATQRLEEYAAKKRAELEEEPEEVTIDVTITYKVPIQWIREQVSDFDEEAREVILDYIDGLEQDNAYDLPKGYSEGVCINYYLDPDLDI